MKNSRYLILPLLLLLLAGGCGKQRKAAVNSAEDLAHARVGVTMGSTYDDYVTKNFPAADISRMDVTIDVITALETGKVDAMVLDGNVYNINLKETGKFRVVDTLFTETFGIGFSHNDPELRIAFNGFLAGLVADGTLAKLKSKWFDDYKNARMPEFAARTGKPINVAFTGATEGFGFMLDGKPAGLDVELLEMFGEHVGRPVVFHPLAFGGLIAALASGKVDVVAAAVTITEERSKQVAFSDPYYNSTTVVLALSEDAAKKDDGLLTDMKDVHGSNTGIMTGTIHDAYVEEKYPTAKRLHFDNYPEMFLALDKRTIDVLMIDGIIYQIAMADEDKYDVLGVLFEDPYGVGFSYDNAVLRDKFNVFLKEIKENGVYDEVITRWVDNNATAEMPDLGPAPEGKPLRFGHTGVSDGFDFIKNGKPAGVEAELLERFGRYVGRPIESHIMNFGGLIAALTTGKVDMIASAMTITEERSKVVAFTDPYYVSESLAIVLSERLAGKQRDKGGKAGYASMEDVKDKRIGVLMSSVQDEHVSKTYPDASVLRIDLMPDLVMALKAGQADAIVMPHPEARAVLAENPDLGVLEQNIQSVEFGIGFRDGELRERFDKFLKEARESGLYEEIEKRWIENTGTAEMPDLTFPRGAKPLVVGTTAQSVPFTFIQNGRNAGFDIELVTRFAASEGRPVEFSTMTFGALIPALVSGKIDILASSAMMTPERKKQVMFSDPYFEVGSMVVALKKDMALADSGPAVAKKNWFERIKDSFYNNLVLEKRYMMIVEGLWQTLIITVFSILLGTVFGGAVCALRMSRNRYMKGFAKGYIGLMRGIPLLVWLMIFFYIVFASSSLSATIVAIFTFALNMGAYSSEMFRTAIESVDRGQTEAGIAMGFTKVQTFIFIVLPQAVKQVLPVYKGEAISLLKSTSIVGYIAVLDLTKASDIIRSRTFDAFFPLIVVAIIYFILAWLLGLALDMLNKKTSSAK